MLVFGVWVAVFRGGPTGIVQTDGQGTPRLDVATANLRMCVRATGRFEVGSLLADIDRDTRRVLSHGWWHAGTGIR